MDQRTQGESGKGMDSGDALAALDEMPLSPKQRKAALLVAFGEFIDGYDLLVMGAALIFIRPQFALSASEVGLLGASTFLGAMVGLLIFGDMSDRLGRRAIFILNLFFFVAFALASAVVTSTTELFIMRFLVGVGVGMDIPTSTAYLAEIAPRRQRGRLQGSLLNIMWILGAMASTLVALPLIAWFGDEAWRWMLGLAALPALLILLGRKGLPESPRWLLARGRIEEAREAFAAFGIKATPEMLSAAPRGGGSYAELFAQPHLRRVLLVSLVFMLNCFSGSISSIATPLVLKNVGALSTEATLLFSALVWLTSLLGTLVGAMLIDRIGRRTLCYLSALPYSVLALIMGAFASHSTTVLVGGYFAISFFNWMGTAVLGWVWASELFPTHLRARSQGVCNACCRLAISLNIFLVPIALAGVGFQLYISLLALPMLLLALVVSLVPMFDSGRDSLERLAATG
jgi:MFS transporter, putative metabolite transport protein